MTTEIRVPDIGDFKNVEIIEVLVKEGDQINKNDTIITLESDKSSVEVPSPFSGKIAQLKVKVGDKVSQGDLLGLMDSDEQQKQEEPITEKILPETERIIKDAEETSKPKSESPIKENKNPRIEIKNQKIYTGMPNINDIDPEETNEWIESLEGVVKRDGAERAHYLLTQLIDQAYIAGSTIPFTQKTPYVNTIPTELEAKSPGNQEIEKKIRSLVRWNAAAMVVRANKVSSELGGHIATFASAATLYDVGCNHFWRAKNENFLGDMIYYQGHAAPGMYARSFLEGRISEEQLIGFRQEVKGGGSVFLSTPLVDAKLLAVSNCLYGSWSNHSHLSSKVYEVFRKQRLDSTSR